MASCAHKRAPVEDIIHISVCSGGAMIKVSAGEQPKFILGQFIVFCLAMLVALVELTIWLST